MKKIAKDAPSRIASHHPFEPVRSQLESLSMLANSTEVAPTTNVLPAPNPALLKQLVAELLNEEDVSRDLKLSGRVPGPRTGFKALDDELGGFLVQGVHTLLSAPGTGKTALCLQIAAQCGCPVLYVSAEMRRSELMRRIIARHTGTYLGKLRGGELDGSTLQRLALRAAHELPQLSLFDAQQAAWDDSDGSSIAALIERGLALKERFDTPHLLVVIDSVTEWIPLATVGKSSYAAPLNDYAMAEAAVDGLKNLAAQLDCPVLAIAHRHRAGQNKDADRLHAAKGTGRFEYISQSLWDLERKTDPTNLDTSSKRVQLTLLKNRYGQPGMSLQFDFEGRLQRFKEVM